MKKFALALGLAGMLLMTGCGGGGGGSSTPAPSAPIEEEYISDTVLDRDFLVISTNVSPQDCNGGGTPGTSGRLVKCYGGPLDGCFGGYKSSGGTDGTDDMQTFWSNLEGNKDVIATPDSNYVTCDDFGYIENDNCIKSTSRADYSYWEDIETSCVIGIIFTKEVKEKLK